MPEHDSKSFPRWAYRKPVTVFMIIASVAVVGIMVLKILPLEFSPEINNPFLWVVVESPNSTPEENDERIGVKLDEQLKQVRNIKRMEIRSTSRDVSADIEFEQKIDMDVAYLEIRDACERVREELPEGTENLKIYNNKSSDWPILWLGVSSDGSQDELIDFIDHRIKPSIERVPGVGKVDVHGFESRKIYIDLNMDSLHSSQININKIGSSLNQITQNTTAGKMKLPGQRILLRNMTSVHTIDQLSALPINPYPYRLKDIAKIEYRYPDIQQKITINGQDGITISVHKASQANTIEVRNHIKNVLRKFSTKSELKNIRFLPFFDQADWILNSLKSLRSSGIWGGFFASMILLLFLRRVRLMMIIISIVPLSVFAALIGLYFLGYSLNVGTMMGLMLALGMLVDNAIVVAENIFRKRSLGMNGVDASITGAGEVGTAITASTATTLIVFLPLVFAEGQMGIWMQQLGVPIIISLLFSLVAALSFVPLAMAYTFRKIATDISGNFKRLHSLYSKVLERILRKPLVSFVIVVLLGASVIYPAQHVKQNFNSGGGERQLFMSFQVPDNLQLDDVCRLLGQYEDIIYQHRDELDVENVYAAMSIKRSYLRLFLKTRGNDLIPEIDIQNRIRELLPKAAGVTWWFGWRDTGSGSANNFDIMLEGDSQERLMLLAEQLEPLLRNIPAVSQVKISDSDPMDEVVLRVDRHKAYLRGISPEFIARTVSAGLMGMPLQDIFDHDREIEVRMQIEQMDRKNIDQLKNLQISSPTGQLVSLNEVSELKFEHGKAAISRINGKLKHPIEISCTQSDVATIRNDIMKAMNAFSFPSGYTWSFGQSFEGFEADQQDYRTTFLLACILVILLLGALFESLIHPFTIFISLPFAFIGVYWTLFLTNTEQDLMSSIGLVLLVGIVVNNSIVLVDHINQLRSSGMERKQAIIQGGSDRLRPIIMTASTTILGLAPMAFSGSQAAGQMYAPLAITVMGGLTSSTLLTLLLIPLFYLFMDNFQISLKRLFFSLRNQMKRVSTTESNNL